LRLKRRNPKCLWNISKKTERKERKQRKRGVAIGGLVPK
jgi:hypothetical protein